MKKMIATMMLLLTINISNVAAYEKKDSSTEGTDGKSQPKEDFVAFEYGSAGSDMATTTSIPSYGWNHNGVSGLQDIFKGSILYQ